MWNSRYLHIYIHVYTDQYWMYLYNYLKHIENKKDMRNLFKILHMHIKALNQLNLWVITELIKTAID